MNQEEIKSSRRMLRELADLAEHASLTGSLSDGKARAIARYNALLAHLIQEGILRDGLFTPLGSDSTFGDVGIESRLLATHLGDDGDHRKDKRRGEDSSVLLRLAPFVDAADLTKLVREQMRCHADFDMDLLTSLAPFLEQSMLGELLHQHLEAAHAAHAMPTAEPAATRPPETAANPMPVASEQQQSTPEDILELLKNPHLSDSERAELIDKLTRSVS
jgi:hypothetical protein